ncbi:predicted protein [Uncinocarpus reesii 1704]|uniref:Uncharacterized protein n=1 Tax=Uncinocarpus reesii (strain UAMH 1704) TaxID=336963 RepID=C4JKW6_UNCRE|nr:uncharacterized protein UREG_00199 [Uncinocarpus reesii 1704]EEP75353.1 predicted protein [Uncinocarpus reesii 1704]
MSSEPQCLTFQTPMGSSAQPSFPQQHQPELSHHQTITQTGMSQAQGKGGPTAAAAFLKEFSLVAEAAKRAQMAVVMRDLESISL